MSRQITNSIEYILNNLVYFRKIYIYNQNEFVCLLSNKCQMRKMARTPLIVNVVSVQFCFARLGLCFIINIQYYNVRCNDIVQKCSVNRSKTYILESNVLKDIYMFRCVIQFLCITIVQQFL